MFITQKKAGNRELARNISAKQSSSAFENYPIQPSYKTIYRAIYAAIVSYNRKSGLLNLVDRKSRFLFAEKLTRLGSKEVAAALIKALDGQSVHTITPMACFASILQKATNTCRNIFFNYVALGLTIRASKEKQETLHS